MRRLVLAGCVYFGLCAGVASAAPVMPTMPNIAFLFDSISAGTTPCFVSGPPAGTVHGCTLNASVPIAYTGNQSFSFNGSSDYVDVVNHASFNITGDITISAWAKVDASNEYSMFIGKTPGTSGATRDYSMGFQSGGALDMVFYSSSGPVISSGLLKDTSWHHWAVTRSGSTFTFYKDGVPTTVAGYSTAFPNNAVTLLIGCCHLWLPDMFYDGLIDEPAIWDRALSANEIEWLAQNSISSIPEPATVFIMALGTGGLLLLRKRTHLR